MTKKLFIIFILIFLNLFVEAQTATTTINFDFDSHEINTSQAEKLGSFLISNNNPTDSIELKGHTDPKGSNRYNDSLSWKRVLAVNQFLLSKNVTSKIIVKAFGESILLKNDDTEASDALNRRVELTMFFKNQTQPPVIDTPQTKSLTSILEDSSLVKGSTINLKNLEFENNSDVLLPHSFPTIEELYTVLVNNPSLEIVLEGHICCVPAIQGVPFTRWPNYDISLKRAKRVYTFLVEKGINSSRLSYAAFGSSRPIFPIPERTENESISNRRVEVRIKNK